MVESITPEGTLIFELSDGQVSARDVGQFVSLVEFDRGVNSFFDRELIDALSAVLGRLSRRADIRAAVLCSAGKHFCAGARLAPGGQGDDAYDRHLYDAASHLVRQPLPLVAAVQGRAVGGGLGLAMVCDFRVAAATSTFDSAFARLGIHHGFGLTVTLPDAVGQRVARRLLYQQTSVDAHEAFALGMCDLVVPDEDLRQEAIAFASSIAAGAPLAVRAIRQTMRQDLVASYDAAVQRERMAQSLLRGTDDAIEGITAQRERRAPRFTGT